MRIQCSKARRQERSWFEVVDGEGLDKRTKSITVQKKKKSIYSTLPSVAQVVGHHPVQQKVPSSILVREHAWVSGARSLAGWVQEAVNRCFTLTSKFLSHPPSSSKKN